MARPVPVFPLVSSITVCPGRISPPASASAMICRAIPVLLGETGIEVVQLGQDPALYAAGDPGELNQGSPADGLYGGGQEGLVSSHFSPDWPAHSSQPWASRTWIMLERIWFQVPGVRHDPVGEHAAVPTDVPAGLRDFPVGVPKPVPGRPDDVQLPAGSAGRQWRPVLSWEPEPLTVASFWATWKSMVQGLRLSVRVR